MYGYHTLLIPQEKVFPGFHNEYSNEGSSLRVSYRASQAGLPQALNLFEHRFYGSGNFLLQSAHQATKYKVPFNTF